MNKKLIGRLCILLLTIFGLVALLLSRPTIDTSLIGLMGKDAYRQELLSIFDDFSDSLQALFFAKSPSEAAQQANTALDDGAIGRDHLINGVPVDAIQTSLQEWINHRGTLLTDADRALLLQGKSQVIAEQAMQTWCADMSPAIIPFAKDPFKLTTHVLTDHPSTGFEPLQGLLIKRLKDEALCWLSFDLKGMNEAAREDFIRALKKYTPYVSGVPAHTATATSESMHEISWLTALISAFILALIIYQFRSLRILIAASITLLIATIVATGVLFLSFQTPHVLVFVFGTTLLGLSVDYILHVCVVAQREGCVSIAKALTRKPMIIACFTTLASFTPLLFSEIVFLKQISVFTIVGLVMAFLVVQLGFDDTTLRFRHASPVFKLPAFLKHIPTLPVYAWYLVAALLALAIVLSPKLSFSNSPEHFYKPTQALIDAEKAFYQNVGQGASTWWIVRGPTIESVLQAEEEANLKGLSSLVPSQKRQTQNKTLIQALYKEQAANFAEALGLKTPPRYEDTPVFTAEDCDSPLLNIAIKGFLSKAGEGWATRTADDGKEHPGAIAFKPKEELEHVFNRCSDETRRLLLYSFTCVLILSGLLFRKKALKILLPLILTTETLLLIASLASIQITIFHLLSLFLLIGLGIDYAVFYQSHANPATCRAVNLSFMTTLVGFGGLALTRFPVTHAIGLTIGLGLICVWGYTLLALRNNRKDAPEQTEQKRWNQLQEQSAGKFRILFLWYVYKFLGPRIVILLLHPIVAVIYLFAKPARAASKAFVAQLNVERQKRGLPTVRLSAYKHIYAYACSLMEKVDAMAYRKALKIKLPDSPDQEAFLKYIQSKRGLFFLCTHIGAVEVLPALSETFPLLAQIHLHSFIQMGQNAIFFDFYQAHATLKRHTFHDVAKINLATAIATEEALAQGDIAIMAGDRPPASGGRTVSAEFLGKTIQLPLGAFKFANSLEHPIFFIAALRTRPLQYELILKEAPVGSEKALRAAYVEFMTDLTLRAPEQFYHFWPIFE